MLRVVMNDETRHIFRGVCHSRFEQMQRLGSECIRFTVKFDEANVIANVEITGSCVFYHGRQSSAHFRKTGNALGPCQISITAVGLQVLQVTITDTIKRFARGRPYKRWHVAAVLLESLDKTINTNCIDHLVRTLDPVVTQFHRIVDGDQGFVDVGHKFGRVAQSACKYFPGVFAEFVVCFEAENLEAAVTLSRKMQFIQRIQQQLSELQFELEER